LGIILAIRAVMVVQLDGHEPHLATEQEGHQGMAGFMVDDEVGHSATRLAAIKQRGFGDEAFS
jgi:hypothetical protein